MTGSRHDMNYYKDVSPWSLNGEKIMVVTENDHLGLIVSGLDEEKKNIDRNITQCRGSLFTLLGPALSFKCKLSPLVQLHLWRTYSLPVLMSGLSALPIRPRIMKPLQAFHNKILRGFLKQSYNSPVASLFFLCGELPIEARLHLDLLNLFHNIWSNPGTKIYEIVMYIVKMVSESSTTWSYHIRQVCLKYGLPDPINLLQYAAVPRSAWKELVRTRVTAYHEAELRRAARSNSTLEYFNVEALGLNGRAHPILDIHETRDSMKLKAHLKFLTGDILSYQNLSHDRGTDSSCRLCGAQEENTQHIITECRSYADVRERLYPELVNLVASINPTSGILTTSNTSNRLLTQFILDPASLNLPNSHRISFQHPRLHELYCLSRDWCFAIYNRRIKLLKDA